MEKIILNKDCPEKWGESLRKIRFENSLDQLDLAELIGTHASYISRIETGKMIVSGSILAGFAKNFNVEFSIQ